MLCCLDIGIGEDTQNAGKFLKAFTTWERSRKFGGHLLVVNILEPAFKHCYYLYYKSKMRICLSVRMDAISSKTVNGKRYRPNSFCNTSAIVLGLLMYTLKKVSTFTMGVVNHALPLTQNRKKFIG